VYLLTQYCQVSLYTLVDRLAEDYLALRRIVQRSIRAVRSYAWPVVDEFLEILKSLRAAPWQQLAAVQHLVFE
jgi:hypothetical protein